MESAESPITTGMASHLIVLTTVIMTAVATKLYSSWSAEARVQALDDLFRMVSARHKHLVKLLMMLEPRHHEIDIIRSVKAVIGVLPLYDHPLTPLMLQNLPYTVKS